MRVAVLISGGKDSALSLHRVLKQGHEVKYLVSMLPKREDSWMFHFPNIHLTALFAEAVEIPLVKAETTGIKETELQDLKGLLGNLDIEGVVSGAISSQYQKTRVDRVCQELHLKSISPLFQENPLHLLEEITELNFDVIIVGVYAYGFTKSWLGRRITPSTIDSLLDLKTKFGISLVGEGGEYETLVLDTPYFKKKIRISQLEKIWENDSGYLLVKEAGLVDKSLRT